MRRRFCDFCSVNEEQEPLHSLTVLKSPGEQFTLDLCNPCFRSLMRFIQERRDLAWLQFGYEDPDPILVEEVPGEPVRAIVREIDEDKAA